MITRRTSERRMFLKPGPAVTAMFLYLLAWAAGLHGVQVLCAYVGSTHYHLVVYDPNGRVSCFCERLNSMLARALNYRWQRVKAAFWDNQELNLVRLVDADAVIDKASYCAANPTQDGVLEAPSDWPGVWLTAADLGKTMTFKRPKTKFFGKRSKMPLEVSMTLQLPPMLAHLTPEEYTTRHDTALQSKVDAAVAERRAANKRFLGLEKLAKTRHTRRARKREKSGAANTIRPRIACSCLQGRIQALLELKAFDAAYTKARKRFADGERDVVFPAGTYQLRLLFGVRVEARGAT